MKLQLNRIAFEALIKATEQGIVTDSETEILDILEQQDCVSYSSSKGSITFDINDLERVA